MVSRDTLADERWPEAEMWPGRETSETPRLCLGSLHTLLNRSSEQNFPWGTAQNNLITEDPPGSGQPHVVGGFREEAETPFRPVGH